MDLFESSLVELTKSIMSENITFAEVGEDEKMPWHKRHYEKRISKVILYLEQEGKCCFCSVRMYAHASGNPKQDSATIEHVQCRQHGGKDDISNYKLSCYMCNNLRGTMDYDAFFELIQKYGRNGYNLIQKAVKKDRKNQAKERKKANELEQQRIAKLLGEEKARKKQENKQRMMFEMAYGALYKSAIYRKAA